MDKELIQREGESFFDWKLRLIIGKIDKEVDLDWSEIRDLLKIDSHPDNLRKASYGIYEYNQYFQEKLTQSVCDDDLLREYEIKKQEIEKEKIKFQDQRREYKKLLTIDARFENLIDTINKAVYKIAKEKPLVPDIDIRSRLTCSDNEGVLLCSDWHSELEVDNFLNTFNKEEFLRRIGKLIDKTIEYGKFHNIKTLHVFGLGDLINGLIHNNARVANNELTVSQTMFVAEVISEMLSKFANKFSWVLFYHVLDNHSRVFANKDEHIAGESFARFIPWYLKPRLQMFDNIEIVANTKDEEIGVTTICGKTIFFTHGHNDKMNSIVSDLALMLKQIPDYVFAAHWHHNVEDEVHGCEVVVNQSLIGVDEYGKKIRKTSKPAQKFMIFNEEDGRQCTYNIVLA
jgi:hypothetical protein